ACLSLVRQRANGFPLDRALLDTRGRVAHKFGISGTPEAVELDDHVRVRRYGRPELDHGGSIEIRDEIRELGARKIRNVHGRPWPSERPFTGAALRRVNTTVSCVLTRFHVTSLFGLVHLYLAFRRVRAESQSNAGLLTAVFLIENMQTCYTLSLWQDDWAIL